ncbi:MAG: hypothetical protein H6977_00660 [Gammaproteobacteria bacterium]|nr:hypothetical protein [Gammaproteobacteria bacterium]
MTATKFKESVRAAIRDGFGDTSDLSEELVNTIANIYYFAIKSAQQDFGGLTDLKDIFPARSQGALVETYSRHMPHVVSAVKHLPAVVSQLRGIREESSDMGDLFEQVTIDMFKFGIEDAINKNELQRQSERQESRPVEHVGLARVFNIPYRRNT